MVDEEPVPTKVSTILTMHTEYCAHCEFQSIIQKPSNSPDCSACMVIKKPTGPVPGPNSTMKQAFKLVPSNFKPDAAMIEEYLKHDERAMFMSKMHELHPTEYNEKGVKVAKAPEETLQYNMMGIMLTHKIDGLGRHNLSIIQDGQIAINVSHATLMGAVNMFRETIGPFLMSAFSEK